MGLDMYLTKRIYIGAKYKHREITDIIFLKEDSKVIPIDLKKIEYIEETVGYWRKANQIHNWFVLNIQDGNDDCGRYSVSHQQLQELLSIVTKLLVKLKTENSLIQNGTSYKDGIATPIMEPGQKIINPELAEEILPSISGFFFGQTAYDSFYIQDLKDTQEILVEALKDQDNEYTYSSSW